jgi:DNA replication protein DnaC
MLSQLEMQLSELKLTQTYEYIVDNNIDPKSLNLLTEICNLELAQKKKQSIEYSVKVSNFPHLRSIDDFDFSFQPIINENEIRHLATGAFIEERKNIILIGTPGVGKTHLATSIGIECAKKRNSTYFIKCQNLLMNLRKAHEENRLEERLKHYRKYKVLIIDELGFMPLDETDAKILFQLIDMRYEFRPVIVTSNVTLDKWYTIFPDITIANAILDRLVHHSYIQNIVGQSYRLKDIANQLE